MLCGDQSHATMCVLRRPRERGIGVGAPRRQGGQSSHKQAPSRQGPSACRLHFIRDRVVLLEDLRLGAAGLRQAAPAHPAVSLDAYSAAAVLRRRPTRAARAAAPEMQRGATERGGPTAHGDHARCARVLSCERQEKERVHLAPAARRLGSGSGERRWRGGGPRRGAGTSERRRLLPLLARRTVQHQLLLLPAAAVLRARLCSAPPSLSPLRSFTPHARVPRAPAPGARRRCVRRTRRRSRVACRARRRAAPPHRRPGAGAAARRRACPGSGASGDAAAGDGA
jgi:hypothetical protein